LAEDMCGVTKENTMAGLKVLSFFYLDGLKD